MKLVNYQKHTWDEIEKFNTKLRKEHYFEITGFWNISELCKEIQIRIPAKRKMFAVFNGKFIILEEGQSITKDEIYKFITGKTEQENKDENEKWLKEKEEEENKWKEKIPSLIPEYVDKLKKLIDKKYHSVIYDYVNYGLNSIYHEFLIEAIIEILEYEKDKSFEEIKKKFYEQGHSGMSYNITVAMFRNLSDRGKEFYEWSKVNE